MSIITPESFYSKLLSILKQLILTLRLSEVTVVEVFFVTNQRVAFFWVSFHSVIFKPCKHIARTFFQPFNNFISCVFRSIGCSLAWFVISVLLVNKNKSHKKILKSKDPKRGPWETSKIISSHELNLSLILTLFFCYLSSCLLTLRRAYQNHMHAT